MKHSLLLIVLLAACLSACDKDKINNGDLPQLTTTAPYDIEAETATSGGSIFSEGSSPVTARGVCWDTIPEPTTAHAKTIDGAGPGDFISQITGLVPGKTYFVRAYATNNSGTGYGSEATFDTPAQGVFVDSRDGNTYRVVIIGSQTWMAENLRYLPEVHNTAEFERRTSPGYGVYGYAGNDVAEAKAHPNYAAYGVLYNWDAAVIAAPAGWHLPSAAEWDELENTVRKDNIVPPGWEGNALKATYSWNCGVAGTDNYLFSALAGGVRSDMGIFFDIGLYSNWWTSTEAGFPNGANYRALVCTYGLMDKGATLDFAGYYVRCVKD